MRVKTLMSLILAILTLACLPTTLMADPKLGEIDKGIQYDLVGMFKTSFYNLVDKNGATVGFYLHDERGYKIGVEDKVLVNAFNTYVDTMVRHAYPHLSNSMKQRAYTHGTIVKVDHTVSAEGKTDVFTIDTLPKKDFLGLDFLTPETATFNKGDKVDFYYVDIGDNYYLLLGMVVGK